MKNQPPGWYRNLDDRRQHGYWDGDGWVDPHDVAPPAEVAELRVEDEVDAEGADAPRGRE